MKFYFTKKENLNIDFNAAPIKAIIEENRKAAVNYSNRLIEDLQNIIIKNKKLYQINWDYLQNSANDFGIDTNSSDWIINYLKAIPIIMLYTPDVQAFVQ